jgi:hypothetical protein
MTATVDSPEARASLRTSCRESRPPHPTGSFDVADFTRAHRPRGGSGDSPRSTGYGALHARRADCSGVREVDLGTRRPTASRSIVTMSLRASWQGISALGTH